MKKFEFTSCLVKIENGVLFVRTSATAEEEMELQFDNGEIERKKYGKDAKIVIGVHADAGDHSFPELPQEDKDYDPGIEFRFHGEWQVYRKKIGGREGLLVVAPGEIEVVEAQGLPFEASQVGAATRLQMVAFDFMGPHFPK